jgi:hypothetical protein
VVDNELAAMVGPLWSEGHVCDVLSVDVDELETGTVLALTASDGGVRVYPVFQFHRRDGVVEVKPALVPFLRALRALDRWTVAVILHTPAPELDDTTPLDWVRRGGSAETLSALAAVLVNEWSAGARRTDA